jgi:hypothetical protein
MKILVLQHADVEHPDSFRRLLPVRREPVRAVFADWCFWTGTWPWLASRLASMAGETGLLLSVRSI